MYGKTQIAQMYGISRPTFLKFFYDSFTKKELKKMNYKKTQRVFIQHQVEQIFLKLGNPKYKNDKTSK